MQPAVGHWMSVIATHRRVARRFVVNVVESTPTLLEAHARVDSVCGGCTLSNCDYYMLVWAWPRDDTPPELSLWRKCGE